MLKQLFYQNTKERVNSALNQAKQSREYLSIVLVLLLSFALNIMGITWGLPHYLDWAPDSIAPFKVLEAAYYRFSNGWYDIYPPLHHAIVAIFIAPFMGYLMLLGGLKSPSKVFPFGFSDPLSALTSVTLISRLVSVFMGTAIILLVYLLVRKLFDHRSALFSALIVALCYPLVYYAHNANVEVPYLFWSLLAIYYFLQVLKQGAMKDYLLFALFGTLAICTKDQAYALFLLSPIPVLWMRFHEPAQTPLKWSGLVRVILDKKLILAVIVAAVTFVFAQNLLYNFPGFIKHVQLIIGGSGLDGPDWHDAPRQYEPTLLGHVQLLQQTMSLLASSLTVPLFGLCLVGCIYCTFRFSRYSLPLLFLAASYYLLFINVVMFVRLRYVLPLGIIMAFFGGKLLADIWHKGPWKKATRPAICLAFAYAALFPIQLDLLFMNEARYAAEQWMQEYFRKDTLVETFAPYIHHKYYPRFPSWVQVRSSRLEAGTQWEPLAIGSDDKVRLPNLYTGREAPDYIVLSESSYRRHLTDEKAGTDQAQVLRDLFQGLIGYTLVASFKTPTLVPIGLSINPRILIFERSE